MFTDGINKAIPFLLLPILTKYLSPSEFGLASNYLILVNILIIFIGINIDGAISANYFRLSKPQLSLYISNAITVLVSSFLLVFILVYTFHAQIFNYTKIPRHYQIITVFLAFFQMITSINMVLWRLEEKPLKFGIYQILQTVLNLGLSLYFIIYLSRGWKGRAEGFFLSSIVFGIMSLYILWKRGYIKFNLNIKYIKDAVFFGLPLVPHSLSIWIRTGIDKILITKYLGVAANGIYSTGFQFGVLLTFLMAAFNNAFVPFLFKKLSDKDDLRLQKTKKKLVKMSYVLMLIIFILTLLLTLISYVLINNFLPEDYKKASIFVFWALLAQAFQGMYLLVGNYIFYIKKTKKFAMITLSCSILQVVLSYTLIQKIGLMGAAYSTVIVSLLNFLVVWYYSAKVYPMPWFKKN